VKQVGVGRAGEGGAGKARVKMKHRQKSHRGGEEVICGRREAVKSVIAYSFVKKQKSGTGMQM